MSKPRFTAIIYILWIYSGYLAKKRLALYTVKGILHADSTFGHFKIVGNNK